MKIFLIAGKARSGKDTAANMIKTYYEKNGKKVLIIGFADHIKNYAKKITGWDGTDETKPRELLQTLGTDIIRKEIDENFFVNRTIDDIKVYKYYFDVIILSDVRFPNELELPKKVFEEVYTIKVERPNFENNLTLEQKKHATETALDNYDNFDYIINNDGDLEKLNNDVLKIIGDVENGC